MDAQRTHEVTIDRYSVRVDGNRIAIVSGAFHYFRVVHEEWKERLRWCKAAGLNTIETVVPWNFHEYREGEFDFEGDKNIGEFLDLCHELGFYAIVRPSPYICAEWDNGGLPLWLQNKKDIALRCANPTLLAHVRRWSDVLLPQLVDRQVTRGGPILMVQIENEYGYYEHAQEREYLEFLRDDLVAHGIEVPLFTCDLPGRGMQLPSVPTCANFGSNAAHYLSILRERQPDSFLFVSELWLAWFDHWGGEHHTRTGRSVANILKEVLAAGGQYNFYMWSGGTNYGYYGGRTTSGDYGAFITTSYDYDAPLGETGYVTDKFGECRLVNYFVRMYTDLCVESEEVQPAWEVESGAAGEAAVHLIERRSPAGGMLFAKNEGTEPRHVTLNHAVHPDLQVSVALLPGETRLFPCDWSLTGGWRLLIGTAEPVGQFENAYFFYGEAGASYEFICEKNGEQARLEGRVPDGEAPVCCRLDDARICVYNREVAKVSDWDPARPGTLRPPLPPQPTHAPTLPMLSFAAVEVPIPTAQGDAHTSVARPLPLEAFGALQGYGWYCTPFDSDGEPTVLVVRGVRDRASVYLNGRYQGVVGAFAQFALCPVAPRQGRNQLAILADNLGRYCFTAGLGEYKGIAGVWLRGQAHDIGEFAECAERECLDLPFVSGQGVLLRITGMR
ncbi:MAG: beta-galactosidase, partial [Firmicutes bacterium]|nr:beta-galactosidase [Bacillota bacterium]